jgi:hypothetical protein
MKKLLTLAAVLAAVVGAGAFGCGGSYKCCNQRSYYDCGSQQEADACANANDFTNCSRNSQKDNSCLPQ